MLPRQITAGTTLELPITLTAYPAPDWQLTLILRGPNKIDLPATARGNRHVINIDAATTADWTAGRYWYAIRVTDGDVVEQIETGDLHIVPDLASAGANYDGASRAERALDAINAVLESRASKDQQMYRINNRELHRTSIADLLKLRSFYAAQVARERRAKRGSDLLGRRVAVRFSGVH